MDRFYLRSLLAGAAVAGSLISSGPRSDATGLSDRRYQVLVRTLSRVEASDPESSVSEIRTIHANLLRWKNLPADLGDTYIWVNIPAFRLELWNKGRLIAAMPVVVGKTATPTPLLMAYIQSVDVQPEWVIPDSIADGEISTTLKNKSFRLKNGIHIQELDGDRSKKIRFVQDPGPTNPLGHFRFNTVPYYKIRLHDSATRVVLADRLLSHGCVRVQSAKRLVRKLDGLGLLNKHEELDDLLRLTRQTRIYFTRRIPVYFVYFTAWVDNRNVIHYEPDIYGLDDGRY